MVNNPFVDVRNVRNVLVKSLPRMVNINKYMIDNVRFRASLQTQNLEI